MNTSLVTRLNKILLRLEDINALLSQAQTMNDPRVFATLSQEYAHLEPIAQSWSELEKTRSQLQQAEQMVADEQDEELRQMAKEELHTLQTRLVQQEEQLQTLMLPQDPLDRCDVFLEIRAGTGGDEAALFAGDLLRMYLRYAERQRWDCEIISQSEGEHGGFREVITRISGRGVYSRLKFESGAHRVQRVPATESQGRIHTSACTVAVLPEVKDTEAVQIAPSDIRVDTYRASGAGGQHINKTDSAVRLTHLPSGIVVECQDERSQHKNRARAMALLQARIFEIQRSKQIEEQQQQRRNLVGSGDRSERIRTYNFPQGRVTDHRINLTLYHLPEILEGGLDTILDALAREHQLDQLMEMAS